MNSQDIQNLQESYLAVYDDETRETLEFGNWVNDLLDEGYDLSDYTWDELYETYIGEERAPGVKPYKAGPTQAEVRADAKKSEKAKKDKDKDKPGYGHKDKFNSDWKLRAVPSSTSKRKNGTEETVSQRMDREAPYKTRPFSPLFTKQGSRTASAVTRATEGPGEPQSVTMPRKKSKPSKEIVRKNLNNSYDLYDIILSHLLDEGYADTYEAAEAIMVNMSEDWRESICEGYVDYKKGKLPSGRTPQQAAQGRTELLNARDRNRPSNQSPLDGTWGRQQHQNRITKEMDTLTAGNPVSRAVRRGLGDMLPGGEPSTNRHREAMDRRNRVADIESAEKKSRGK
jgi:hypothetical protein